MTEFNDPSQDEIIHDAEILKTVKFGATRPSPKDSRDLSVRKFINFDQALTAFPSQYESIPIAVSNQCNVASGVAHACCAAILENNAIYGKTSDSYSIGYLYGNRANSDLQEEGMILSQALKALKKNGIVTYMDFPHNVNYSIAKELISEQKKSLAKKAAKHCIENYFRCDTIEEIKAAIIRFGSVIVCIPVYTDFGRNLHVTKTCHLLGYHALILTGWTVDNKWIAQNSWGYFWGYSGKLLIDIDYPISESWAIIIDYNEKRSKPFGSKLKKMINNIITFIRTVACKKIGG